MKIGMVSKYPEQQDGIALYSAALCEGLEEAGITVVKIGDRESTTAHHRIDFKSFSLKSQLKRIAEEEKLDLLHIQYIAPHFGKLTLNLNLLVALSQKVPVVVTFHEVHTATETLKEKALSFLQKWITKKASAAIAHTRQQKEFLQLKYKKKQAYAVYHHLITKLMPMHITKGKNILLFGMLSHGKGAEYLIRAMNELPGFNLTIAGKAVTADYENLLRESASENKLGNVRLDIRWVPENEKLKYLDKADIMVFPYIWAPYQSGTLHNAFAYGIPVVVSDVGALAEIVKEFRCGVVVEPRSPKAIAAGIRKVHSSYGIYQRGVEKYRQDANLEKIAKRHAEIYDETLQEYYETHGVIEEEKRRKAELAEKIADDLAEESSPT
ncbi:glycosyltransferase [Candidatus Woesearchaeota archaeon]|nr:glycosyltransferase [Candidatus Woesearchaeota archaeon]